MDGSFCGFTADESCGGTSRGVGGPACLRDGGGSVASSFSFHKPVISSCANESLRSRLTLREEGQVAGLESPNGLGATTYFPVGKTWSRQY